MKKRITEEIEYEVNEGFTIPINKLIDDRTYHMNVGESLYELKILYGRLMITRSTFDSILYSEPKERVNKK